MNHTHWLPRLNAVMAVLAVLFFVVFTESRDGSGYLLISAMLGISSLALFLIRKLLVPDA